MSEARGYRVLLTADGRYVREGNPDGVELAYGPADEVPKRVADELDAAEAAPEPARREAPAKRSASRSSSKRAGTPANKGGTGSGLTIKSEDADKGTKPPAPEK